MNLHLMKKVRAWTHGLPPVEDAAITQISNVASLDIVWPGVAVMPDVHFGYGAPVGTVIPTIGAIIPSAVGVDIGCGVSAQRTSLHARQLPDSLAALRSAIEAAVPHGRTNDGGPGDRGAWGNPPDDVGKVWAYLNDEYAAIVREHPKAEARSHVTQLGTLGTGNHFIELCIDEDDLVWVMLHSGSRGVGNRIGTYFTQLAQQDMASRLHELPDKNLAYFTEGAKHFDDYFRAVLWAQSYATENRRLMMYATLQAMRAAGLPFMLMEQAVSCHHNYVNGEMHFDTPMYITRKGAVSAQRGQLGIIPGSMGAQSFIVRGKGNPDSFCSCSHGAGRTMSRTEAKKRFTVADHVAATAGVECRKDESVLDETPGAYKDIWDVMRAQSDLVDVVHVLKQVLCVKG